jgi:uncharacterized protein YjbI with pentapeptide repeats
VDVTSWVGRHGRPVGWAFLAAALALVVWFTKPWWSAIGNWLHELGPLLVALALAATGTTALALRRRAQPREEPRSDNGDELPRPLSHQTIVLSALLVVAAGVIAAVVLLRTFRGASATAQLEAIRIAGSIVVGTGGGAALLLAARRQRAAELALAAQRQVARATEAGAVQWQITELYTRAVGQLGSERAPVRLGGVYALERLAQGHPDQRQTIVNVLSAYLRMPYELPGDPPGPGAAEETRRTYRLAVQEREVRLAAQRVLAHHLRPDGAEHPATTFWADTDFDLTGATLIDVDFRACRVRCARFRSATLVGRADFEGATCTGPVDFTETTFTENAVFTRTTCTGRADFGRATFAGNVHFDRATFGWDVVFAEAVFRGRADFADATFTGYATFARARFAERADFVGAAFADRADFTEARFSDRAYFMDTRFTWGASFRGATFAGPVPAEITRFLPAGADEVEGPPPAS